MFHQRKIGLGLLVLMFVFVGASLVRAEETVPETSEASQPNTDESIEEEVGAEESQVQEKAESSPTAEKVPAYINSVVPLELLNMHYERQMSSVRKMMDHWNEKILFYVERRNNIRLEMELVEKKILELAESQNSKSKKETSRLNKRLKRLEKDQGEVSKDIQKQRKYLVKALKEESKESQTALKEIFAEVREKVEITEEK
jgi:hypothetical protein